MLTVAAIVVIGVEMPRVPSIRIRPRWQTVQAETTRADWKYVQELSLRDACRFSGPLVLALVSSASYRRVRFSAALSTKFGVQIKRLGAIPRME